MNGCDPGYQVEWSKPDTLAAVKTYVDMRCLEVTHLGTLENGDTTVRVRRGAAELPVLKPDPPGGATLRPSTSPRWSVERPNILRKAKNLEPDGWSVPIYTPAFVACAHALKREGMLELKERPGLRREASDVIPVRVRFDPGWNG